VIGIQLEALHALGFTKTKQNVKLLLQTCGNFEVVKNFLEAKKKVQEVAWNEKGKLKLEKQTAKLAKKSLKDKKRREEPKEKRREEPKEKRGRRDRKIKKEIDPAAIGNDSFNAFFPSKEDKKEVKRKEKQLRREQKLALKLLKRGPAFPTSSFPSSDALPPVYLDGNNMLFVCSALRALVLKRKMRLAEQLLVLFAKQFAAKVNAAKCALIYDETPINEVSESFVVCSARPKYQTSDDALVEWAKANSQANAAVGIFVSSDRELLSRLTSLGATVVKPKDWFKFAAEKISGSPVQDLDLFMNKWVESVQPEKDLESDREKSFSMA